MSDTSDPSGRASTDTAKLGRRRWQAPKVIASQFDWTAAVKPGSTKEAPNSAFIPLPPVS